MWKKDGVEFKNPLLWQGRRIFNPSAETLTAAGFVWVSEELARRQEFEAACADFRAICAAIGELIGQPEFRGGFDEMSAFEASAAAQSETGVQLAIKWIAADKLCTYLAAKIGIGQPDWWKKCWELD